MRALFEWWGGLPWWLRLGVPIVVLLASTVLWLVGVIWPWGWAVGIVLLIFSLLSGPDE